MWLHLSFLVQASFSLFMQSSLVQTSSGSFFPFCFFVTIIGYSQYRHFLYLRNYLLLGFGDFILVASLSQVKRGDLAWFALLGLACRAKESEIGKILFVEGIKWFSVLSSECIIDFTFDELKFVFTWDTSHKISHQSLV